MYKQVPSIQVKSRQVPSIRMPSIGLLNRREGREPSPYIELPYIVSEGRSWADTGLYLDPTIHRVQGSFIVDSLDMFSGSNLYRLEGARDNGGGTAATKVGVFLRKLSPTTFEIRREWGVLGNSGTYDPVIYEVGKEYSFDFTPEYTQIGELKIEKTAYSRGACTNTYYIGGFNDSFLDVFYVPPGIRGTKRIFSVYATGEVIGLSTPTLAKETNLFGYFDKVSGKYLENKGTEPWTAAYEAWVYQMGRPLSGLVFSGEQYIDTKYIVKSNTKIKSSFIVNNDSITCYIYGADNGSSNKSNFGIFSDHINKIMGISNRLTDSYNYVSVPIIINRKWNIEHSHQNVTINGELKNYPAAGEIALPSTSILIGAIHRGDSKILFLRGEVNAYEVLEDDLIVQKLIPLITWEGIKGYLNLVNRELLLNQGTGEFQIPMIPVYAINWRDENFDPIAGKVASIGSGYTSGLLWDNWTEAQKQTFRGKKMRVSWRMSANEVVIGPGVYYGFVTKIYYKDGTSQTVSVHGSANTIFSGLNSPYTLIEDYSLSAIIQIEDKEIDSIVIVQNRFYLPQVQSGELKAYDIKWEVDVPEWEIDAIETLNSIGIAASADYQENKTLLNSLGIEA